MESTDKVQNVPDWATMGGKSSGWQEGKPPVGALVQYPTEYQGGRSTPLLALNSIPGEASPSIKMNLQSED